MINQVIKNFSGRYCNYIRSLKNSFTGEPLKIQRHDYFYKVALSPLAVGQLNREVSNSQSALGWDIYSENVVVLKKVTPFIAKSVFINEGGKSWKTNVLEKEVRLVNICTQLIPNVLEAPRKRASKIIQSQINHLNLNSEENSNIFHHFQKCINSSFFDYKMPTTPMHGDFNPSNSVICDNKIFLVDWEYAYNQGSILYDWWYLKSEIENSRIFNEDIKEAFNSFLAQALLGMGLLEVQFNAFGLAMHIVKNISRLKIRNTTDCNEIDQQLDLLNSIIAK